MTTLGKLPNFKTSQHTNLSCASLAAVAAEKELLSMMKLSSATAAGANLPYFLNWPHECLVSVGYASQSLPRTMISPLGPVRRDVLDVYGGT